MRRICLALVSHSLTPALTSACVRATCHKAGVRLPGDEHADSENSEETVLRNASGILRNFTTDKGTVESAREDFVGPGTMFVERAALVEHLCVEAGRLHPER